MLKLNRFIFNQKWKHLPSKINLNLNHRSLGSVAKHHNSEEHHNDEHHHDDHDHHPHKPLGPYELPHHAPYPNKAYLFGINPDKEYKQEGWEVITIGTYVICFLILFIGSQTKNLNSFKTWAKDEAIARNKVIENGGEIVFGKWYSKVEYQRDENDMDTIDQPPSIKEGED